jgi:proline dehydrogenase
MLRAFLLYLSRATWAQKLVVNWPLARSVARRFVAGETEDDVVGAIRKLNEVGITATVDVLGESITEVSEARRTADAYVSLIERIPNEKLDAFVSIKLTALGLDVDPQVCRENVLKILQAARERKINVAVDMEDHTYTDRTLDLVREFRAEGFKNVQAVVQAYLYRTGEDVAALAEEGVDVRLCKGAYKEPAEVAYPKKADTDAAYIQHAKTLLDATRNGGGYPGLATHDEEIIKQVQTYVNEKSISRDKFEFQMLHGIKTDVQKKLVADGYHLRVYVAFGTAWYGFFMRRLAERPANLWFFMSNILRR